MEKNPELTKFIFECCEEARARLGSAEKVDDQIAMRLIIESVFDNEISKEFSHDELEMAIQRIFLMTRRRLGILQPLIDDEEINEIMVNGPNDIFIEKNGKVTRCEMCFESVEELEEVMRAIAGQVHREINEKNPIVDARLADGSRVNGVYKNIAINGPILTIRKFSEKFMRMQDLVENGTVSEVGAAMLEELVMSGYNIFVSGGTSSGKTTLLNALAEAIPSSERVIVCEDSAELKMHYIDNIVHMECRNANSAGLGKVSMADLIKSSLRMRPNRIIVGEVRGDEVVDMLQAMNTGHDGSLSTGHANSVRGMLRRLETLYLSAMPISVEAVRQQIAEGLDILVHIEKLEDGRRRITEITELCGYENGDFKLNVLMELRNGELVHTGNEIVKNSKLCRPEFGYSQILEWENEHRLFMHREELMYAD